METDPKTSNPDVTQRITPEARPNPKHQEQSSSPMKMDLPLNQQHEHNSPSEMLDLVKSWDLDFKRSATKWLRELYGYKNAEVIDFECLLGKPGYDEDDYELTVHIGVSPKGKVGDETLRTIKVKVRRAAEESS